MVEKLLILHGWEDSSKKGFIPELVKTLKEKGYEVFAYDQPNTDAPKFEEWFTFAEEKIKEIGDDNLSIVGHSMGGLLALKLAEKHKVKRLVLVAPVGSKPSEGYFKSVKAKIGGEAEEKIYREYQNRDVDVNKIKQNAKEIVFVFGKKDPWIVEEIRNFYTEKFKDVAKINVYDNYAHMTGDEGVKKLPEVEKLFDKIGDGKTEVPEKKEEKDEEKKKVDKKKGSEDLVEKKEEAIAIGRNLHMSKKQGVYICDFIKNKKIDEAINLLEEVKKLKRAVPYKGEIPHRKGEGMMSGRYPVNGSGLFISMLKSLKGNVIVNGLDLDKSKIYFASASWAARPVRRENRRAKRTNVILKAKEVVK